MSYGAEGHRGYRIEKTQKQFLILRYVNRNSPELCYSFVAKQHLKPSFLSPGPGNGIPLYKARLQCVPPSPSFAYSAGLLPFIPLSRKGRFLSWQQGQVSQAEATCQTPAAWQNTARGGSGRGRRLVVFLTMVGDSPFSAFPGQARFKKNEEQQLQDRLAGIKAQFSHLFCDSRQGPPPLPCFDIFTHQMGQTVLLQKLLCKSETILQYL